MQYYTIIPHQQHAMLTHSKTHSYLTPLRHCQVFFTNVTFAIPKERYLCVTPEFLCIRYSLYMMGHQELAKAY
jgi:hypothetical protein